MKAIINQITDNKKLIKHLKTAIFVGVVLNLINQWEPITNIEFDAIDFLKCILTFFVPFFVSVYSVATISKIDNK